MAASIPLEQLLIPKTNENAEEEDNNIIKETYKKFNNIIPTLPIEKGWIEAHDFKYQGSIWLGPRVIFRIMLVQQHFQALPTDTFLATLPKSGTTWFKSLIFAIINRGHFDIPNHPLVTNGPHDCIPFLEECIALGKNHLHHLPDPNIKFLFPGHRFFSTHMHYSIMPPSVAVSGCRIIYIFRNPKDVFTSFWHFYKKIRPEEVPPFPLEEAFEMFCKGISPCGPFWDHVLGYWNAHLESPTKVLFLTYEGMKREPLVGLKKLAEFLNQPFSLEEESGGAAEEILKLCSFESLSNLEVNKTGVKRSMLLPSGGIVNNSFFRKGNVGDWQNHLTAEMVERLDQIIEQKFGGTGLMDYLRKE